MKRDPLAVPALATHLRITHLDGTFEDVPIDYSGGTIVPVKVGGTVTLVSLPNDPNEWFLVPRSKPLQRHPDDDAEGDASGTDNDG